LGVWDEYVIQRKIVNNERPTFPSGDDLLYGIYDACVAYNPEERPQFHHIVQALREQHWPSLRRRGPRERRCSQLRL
jgi:hypothetical protein